VSNKRPLKFADADAVAADVRLLCQGYSQSGNWSLQQSCWHLAKALRSSMRPGPHEPVETGIVKKMQLRAILLAGRIPSGVKAPDHVVPPTDVPESAIEDFLAALEELKQFKGDFAPHRMLGNVGHEDFIRLHLIHCAHHLSHLRPAPTPNSVPAETN
jgi:hypothetical protein